MNNIGKFLAAGAALITAIGGLLGVVLNSGGDSSPQPITHIYITEMGDYQEFVDSTDLEHYTGMKD
jgi:hypothetical protein